MPNSDASIDLTLVIPSLLGPLPNIDIEHYADVQWRRLPALETLLAKADSHRGFGSDFEESLFSLFAMPAQPTLPIAALTALVDIGRDQEGCWLRVDPVHMQADRAQLILHGERLLQVQQQEADTLIDELNHLYADEGWKFYAPVPHRWYLRLPSLPRMQSTPLARVMGHDINRYLPQGEEGLKWHAVMNEIQMLFHHSPVNQRRMEQGTRMINSVWCWGEGELPDTVTRVWDAVYADGPVARGLALLSDTPCKTVPASAEQWLAQASSGRQLVVLEQALAALAYGDIPGWAEALQQMEEAWFGPLLHAIRSGQLNTVTLLSGDGVGYEVSRGKLRRFWRRSGTINRYLAR